MTLFRSGWINYKAPVTEWLFHAQCTLWGNPFFHAKFIMLTYSWETEKTGRSKDGNMCVYITQNKQSKWRINNEAVNISARPLPTNHSLCQKNRAYTNAHIHTYWRMWQVRFKCKAFLLFCLADPPPYFCSPLFCPLSPWKPADV